MDRSEIPSLDDLRAFETVARTGSVRLAADALALTHGAVSRRIAKLSGALGIKLLEPDGRGVRLTVAGERLAKATGEGFAIITDALAELRHEAATPPLVISCERSVAIRWLIPRLSSFQDAHPEVDLHLSVGGGALDFARDRVGIALRRLDFPLNPRWSVETLLREEVGPVMPPDFADRFQAGDYIALASRTRPDAWTQWLDRHPAAPRPAETRFMDHHFLMVEAAATGLGVAICPKVLAVDDLERGRLIAPCGFSEDGTAYGLIKPAENGSEDITRLRNWLIAQAATLSDVQASATS